MAAGRKTTWFRTIALGSLISLAVCDCVGTTYMTRVFETNIIAYDGKVVFAQETGSITMLDLETGAVLLRKRPVAGVRFDGGLRHTEHGLLMVGYSRVTMLHEDTLDVLWATDASGAAVGSRRFISHDGYETVSCNDIETGARLWSRNMPEGWDLQAIVEAGHHGVLDQRGNGGGGDFETLGHGERRNMELALIGGVKAQGAKAHPGGVAISIGAEGNAMIAGGQCHRADDVAGIAILAAGCADGGDVQALSIERNARGLQATACDIRHRPFGVDVVRAQADFFDFPDGGVFGLSPTRERFLRGSDGHGVAVDGRRGGHECEGFINSGQDGHRFVARNGLEFAEGGGLGFGGGVV